MNPRVVEFLATLVPDAEPDTSLEYPTCAYEKCKSYDGKRCRLTGFRPGGTCEPTMAAMGDLIEDLVHGERI